MANTTAKQVDALGFDRMEIANVRRCYMANKVNYKKLDKLYQEATQLKAKIDSLTKIIETWDAPARQLAKDKLGVELSSEDIMLAHDDIQKFYELHPEMLPNEEQPEAEGETAEPVEEQGPVF